MKTILRPQTIVRLKECNAKLLGIPTYKEAVKILKYYRFILAEYGKYSRDKNNSRLYYAFFNHNGLRANPFGIQIIYCMKKNPQGTETADKVKEVRLLLFS